jgi:DNA polymerase III sliding clamp (beta) subunit (PCNA family)
VATVEAEGTDANWRLPSSLAAGIMAALPLGAGQNVTISTSDGSLVTIEAGKKRAEIRCIEPSGFPIIKPFEPSNMATVEGMARRIEQASWCTDGEHPILNGVYMDGENVIACDRISMVSGPCAIPVDNPITVPLRSVAPLLRNVGPIKMRATEKRLEIMPDDDTQIACTLLNGDYPNVGAIRRDEFGGTFKVNVAALVDAINGMLVLVRGERYPYLHLRVGKDTLALDMQVEATGKMEDEIAISTEIADQDEFDLWITPQNLLGAVSHAGNDEITFCYGPANTQAISVQDGRGYEYWGMPLRPPGSAPGPAPA